MEPLKPPEPRSDLSIWGDKFRVTNLPTWLVVSILVVGVMAGGVWGAVKIGLVHTGDKVVVERPQLVLLQQAQRHFGEKPTGEFVLRDGHGRCSPAVTQTYDSDCSIMTVMTVPGVGRVQTWSLEPAPLPAADARALGIIGSLSFSLIASPAYAAGNCYAAPVDHPGTPEQRNDPPDAAGWFRAQLLWPDGCSGFYVYNVNGSAIVDGNNQPRFTWTHCVH
jgi:hypothetical protein